MKSDMVLIIRTILWKTFTNSKQLTILLVAPLKD